MCYASYQGNVNVKANGPSRCGAHRNVSRADTQHGRNKQLTCMSSDVETSRLHVSNQRGECLSLDHVHAV
jgi:hypothetical protein